MTRLIFLLSLLTLCFHSVKAQDTLVLGHHSRLLNISVTDYFTLYESLTDLSIEEFFERKNKLTKRKMTHSVENLDFTSGTFYIDFVLINPTDRLLQIDLETARPITNGVDLLDTNGHFLARSGDAIPFSWKDIPSNRSVLPIQLEAGEAQRFILKLHSDGEIISLPMIFWETERFDAQDRIQQLFSGLFYGIFIFVIIIYLNFFLLLRDRLFLFYTVYVLFSGLLQFVLDGYGHQFFFPSGGYLNQHSVIIVAGLTVFFALHYALRYLELKGKVKALTLAFAGLVALTIGASLIPGKIYEICYPLINGFSFLAILFLFIVALRERRHNLKISRLFLLGLVTLMAGAIIFILGNFSVIDIPVLTQNSLKAGTLFEIICLSILMAGKYKILQEEKEQAQQQLLLELEEKNRIAAETNIRLEKEVAARTQEIEQQRQLLKERNEDVMASIKYAQRIQKAVLSNEQKFQSILPDSFVFYQPKDIVSGDFYWIERVSTTEENPIGLIVYATADCTGHGVPGAFVSIICNNLLKLGKTQKNVNTPAQALDFTNREINKILNSEYSDDQIRDGMDVALCAIDLNQKILHFAGAKNGVCIVRGKELIEIKGDRKAIGYQERETDIHFTDHSIPLQSGDMVYTFTDGYMDQFGGPDGKKYSSRRLKDLLLSIAAEPLLHQRAVLENSLDIWKDETEQLDDVLVIGVRVN